MGDVVEISNQIDAAKKAQAENLAAEGEPLQLADMRVIAARAAHEVNRAWCKHNGDHTQQHWEGCEEWQRQSAIKGVEALIRNPHLTPQQQHSMRRAHKEAEGWTYGEEKDPEAKKHPCMVIWVDLPPEQQVKDLLFQATVRGVIGLPVQA